MPGFKDFADGDELPESDLDDYLMKQTVMKFATVSARDAALTGTFKREGMVVYRDDGNTLEVSRDATAGNWSTIGPVHGAWLDWTPTVTQSASVSVTVARAKYMRLGRLIIGDCQLTVTGAGTGGNAVRVSMPVTWAHGNTRIPLGAGIINDDSANFFYDGKLVALSTTAFAFALTGAAEDTYLGSTTFTAALAASDVIGLSFTYEAASDA